MAYTITTTAGTTLATVADGTVNTTTTSITLIGKNYAGYGIFLNENYVKLLENFASGTAPTGALTGQIWYDSATQVLKVYKGLSSWKTISSTSTSPTQPSGAVTGDLWWDTSTNRLSVYSGSDWVVVGPAYTSTAGTSGALVETIIDTSSVSHIAVKLYVSNTVVAIFSKDSSYTPQTSISGFTSIKPGLNLVSSSTIVGAQFTGDVSNALTLQGVSASAFLRSDQNTATSFQITAGGGLIAGSDLQITSVTASNLYSSTLNKDFNIQVNRAGSTTSAIAITGSTAKVTLSNDFQVGGATQLTGALSVGTTLGVSAGATFSSTLAVTGAANLSATLGVTGATTLGSTLAVTGVTTVSNKILPSVNNTIDIGSSSFKFANIFATNISGVTISGTASTALYADLAERFEADAAYAPGTVVELGGLKEITRAVQELSDSVFGVISTRAAYLMNAGAGSDATHPAVAMSGRVPVRVIGKIKKGDRLVSAGNGLARAATKEEMTAFNVIGRALEDKQDTNEGVVEAIVKLNS